MHWLRWNAVGLFALVLAVVAVVGGAEAVRAGALRDEQVRAIPRRLARGEADLAEQHQRAATALSEYADVTRAVAYRFAGLAAVAAALHVSRSRPNMWLAGLTVLFAAGAVALALESRAEPNPAPAAGRA